MADPVKRELKPLLKKGNWIPLQGIDRDAVKSSYEYAQLARGQRKFVDVLLETGSEDQATWQAFPSTVDNYNYFRRQKSSNRRHPKICMALAAGHRSGRDVAMMKLRMVLFGTVRPSAKAMAELARMVMYNGYDPKPTDVTEQELDALFQ